MGRVVAEEQVHSRSRGGTGPHPAPLNWQSLRATQSQSAALIGPSPLRLMAFRNGARKT